MGPAEAGWYHQCHHRMQHTLSVFSYVVILKCALCCIAIFLLLCAQARPKPYEAFTAPATAPPAVPLATLIMYGIL